jgi:hypothetical protein
MNTNLRERLKQHGLLRAMSAALMITAASAAGYGAPGKVYSRFGYCAPPVSPSCIDQLKDHPDRGAACEADAGRYVASVFAYRACLSAEMERAVRETNDALRKVRCAKNPAQCAVGTTQPEPAAEAGAQARKRKTSR